MYRRLIYQVAVGEVPAFYQQCIDSVARYARRIGAEHRVQRKPKLKIAPLDSSRSNRALRLGYLPILEKECAFALLPEYGSIAILDADVYVRDRAPDIFDQSKGCDFAGVLERDIPSTSNHVDKLRKYSKGQYETLTDVDWDWNDRGAAFYNMGVLVLNQSVLQYLDGQTPEQFLRRPEFERFINGEGHWKWSTDQTLLNWWVKKSGMTATNLDWRFNTLYGAALHIDQAWFVHFFLADKMPRKGAEIPEIIKQL